MREERDPSFPDGTDPEDALLRELQQVRAERDHLAALVRSSREAIFGKDLEGRITSWNEGARRLYGWEAREILGRSVRLLVPEDRRDELERIMETVRAGAPVEGLDTVRVDRDGRRLDVTVTVSPILEGGGSVVGASVVAHDIGERKALERRLREREVVLRTAIENAPVAIYVKDLQGRYQVANASAEAIFDHGEVAAVGRTDRQLMSPERAEALRANDREVLADPRPRSFEETLDLDDGPHHFLSVKFPVHDTAGRLVGVGGVSTDITERRRDQAERDRLLAALDATLESIPDALMIYEPDGRLVRMNRPAQALTGFTEDAMGRTLAERTLALQVETPEGEPVAEAALPFSRAAGGETVVGQDLVFRGNGARPRWVTASAGPIRSRTGEILGVVMVLKDITELHEAQERERDYLRAVSHDLRTPMTAIRLHTHLLRRGFPSEEPRFERSLTAIDTGLARLDRMIQDLVDAMRVESRQLRIEIETVDLDTFLPAFLERLGEAVAAHRLRLQLPSGIGAVRADPVHVERILTNLLTNALKYSPEEAPVDLVVAPGAEEVRVSVRDRGPGIAAESLPRLFQRFSRPEGAEHVSGLGLGLYISKGLVEAQGGRIWVETEVGEGATFSFSLPR